MMHTDVIRLVVLRGVGGTRLDILDYVKQVVKEAVQDRKNVRVSDKANFKY